MRPHLNPFVRALRAVMRRNAAQVALRCRGDVLDYGELLRRAGVLRDIILAQGVAPGERIALLGQRDSADYVGMLAILLAGCAYVPLNPKAPQARNAYILRHSGATALLVDTACSQMLAPEPGGAVRFALNSETGVAIAWPGSQGRIPDEHLADGVYVMYTSGTTGQPKGVPITGSNLTAYLSSLKTNFEIRANDRVAHLSDLSFDLSVHEILLAWANGATLCCIPQSSALLAARYVEDEGITVWVSVPSTISLAHKAGTLAPGSMRPLRLAFFCGESLPLSTVRQLAAAAPEAVIFNLWGPTEGTVSLSYFRVDPCADLPEIMPIGLPYAGQLLGLFDAGGVPVAAGEMGELWASGAQLTSGYWQNAALNAERFSFFDGRRWYRSGDLAVWDERHGYCYKGRSDRQVKVKGYRIELQECEAVIRAQSGCESVSVVPWARSDSGGVLSLLAFIEAKTIDLAALKKKLTQVLPPYMVPAQIVVYSPFPYTANGKLDILALEAHAVGLLPA